MSRQLRLVRRIAGGILFLLATAPFYRLLPLRETGLAGEGTAALSDITAGVIWSGALLVLIPAILLARLVRPELLNLGLERIGALVQAPRIGAFAAGLALLTGAATLGFSALVLEGKPNLIDAMAQLVHARYLAEGMLAGPVLAEGEFWLLQNSLNTAHGWVSQYPPGHLLLLAAGFRWGAVWAVGPALAAATVFFTALAAERLLPEDRGVARLGAILVAVSPFLIGLAGAYMNHVTAAAFGAAAVYFALRARDGHSGWAVPTGFALAWIFGTRPLSAIVCGAVVAFGVWLPAKERGAFAVRGWIRRVGLACVGALPFILLLCAYNDHFFGSPFTFGYTIAHGETTRLGFHRDPWGNWYGPLEAIAYTSADLVALSLHLLETPIPLVAVVGLFLLLASRLSRGEGIIAAWAVLPVVANLFYWHHGLFMGPRMLNEAAPAWGLLAAVAVVGIVRRVSGARSALRGKYSVRVAVTAFFAVPGVLATAWLAPQRLLSYGGGWQASSRIEAPRVQEPSLVFVHGAWTARVAARLAATGMRLDSVETALRQNSACAVHHFSLDYAAVGDRQGSPDGRQTLDLEPRSRDFPRFVEISPGNRIRVVEGERWTDDCLREAHADRNGIIDVSPLLWQGDLPGLPARGAMFVRDMGPEANERLIRRYPERVPLVLYLPAADEPPVLVPYDEGIAAIWGGEVGLVPRP